MSDAGMTCAGWYLKNVVSRVEPTLSRWTGGRLTSLPISPIVFVESTGARTGRQTLTLLTYFTDGEDVILVGSNFGRPTHPAWYHNLKARPEVTLQARGRQGRYLAREAVGAERDRLWSLAQRWTPPLSRYQAMAGSRTIPLMRCVPVKEAR